MKKYGLITLLSLFCISHATAQSEPNADEYYKKVLENTQTLDTERHETAETIYKLANDATKKIKEINEKLATIKAEKSENLEELQNLQRDLQIELSILQANLQADALKLQSLEMMAAKNTRTKTAIREEEEQQRYKVLGDTIKKELKKSEEKIRNLNVGL
ncbi:type IV secretion system protein VirB5 [Bartonella doshiae]|uniref:VirB5 n=1 Tax=Bartonella sp. A538 TaxID=1263598 RepID=K9MX31_9HYPH|nr:type IV secretion system protein VirB5 [Bartonella doshiae]AFY07849.1 VirB5 [Bartonella sp. A538]